MNPIAHIGKLISTTRKAKGWTQGHLAEKSALSRATISQLERGIIPDLGIRKLERLAGVLGLRLALTRQNPMPTLDELRREFDRD